MRTEKIVILCCFIVIGVYIIIVAAGYPSIPHTMNPGFFPIVASALLVCLSLAELLMTLFVYSKNPQADGDAAAISESGSLPKIILVNVILTASVLVMRYILPVLGIFVFLLVYLILISKQRIKFSIPVSFLGTAGIYAFVKLLRIPL